MFAAATAQVNVAGRVKRREIVIADYVAGKHNMAGDKSLNQPSWMRP
jgi:hypothetical protein